VRSTRLGALEIETPARVLLTKGARQYTNWSRTKLFTAGVIRQFEDGDARDTCGAVAFAPSH
jgi:hypothetical protein